MRVKHPPKHQQQAILAVHDWALHLMGYDHSYFFIAAFIAEHLQYHARALKIS